MSIQSGERRYGASRSRWFLWRERLIETTIAVCSAMTILSVFLILLSIVREAIPIFFTAEDPASANFGGFFGQIVWQPVSDNPRYSLLPLILGTAKITVIAMSVAVPIGVLAALFSAEFAPRWVGEIVKPFVELLAGIPSVVMGFFALIILASIVQTLTGAVARLNALNAGLALGLAIIPVIYSVSEDALRAVPNNLREASLALGCNNWKTAVHAVLPAASSGIFASIVLGLGRAVGETMVVLMASGNAALVSWNPLDTTRTMSATIAAEMGEVVVGGDHYRILFLIGVILFGFTMILNILAGWYLSTMKRRLSGEV
ncbi:MAG: phosphate ABC transporter permease subunit PstC [Candidatus Eisenbacteria bacterium]|nr:phosphate ABC transporter permease subunit PstC [Candidatus Eisenbacteria bacterium]